MVAFHVFVDGPTDDTPAGLERLANAIAKHYGLGAADLLARLRKGRFRVKTNTDRATADTYARDLQRLGARCTIEEATADNSQRSTPIPFPAVRPDTPPAGMPVVRATPPAGTALPPRTTTPPAGTALPPRTSTTTPPAGTSALPPRASTPPPVGGPTSPRPSTPPPMSSGLAAAGAAALAAPGGRPSTPPPIAGAAGQPQFASGLSAAFSGEMPAADLGALGAADAGFSLASLDGVDDNSAQGGSIGPPPSGGGMPASIGPAPEKPPGAADGKDKAANPKDEPLDMFAPPEMQGEAFKVDIASDEADFSARKRASTPPPMETVDGAIADGGARASSQRIPTTPAARTSQPSLQVPNQPVAVATSVPSKLGPLADERVRFAAGVVLAVLLGFIPAHFVAKMQEDSANETIDRKVMAAQGLAETPEMYANLDKLRADQLDRKESEHRNAAIIGFAIWALVGGGFAFVWMKKIPWDA